MAADHTNELRLIVMKNFNIARILETTPDLNLKNWYLGGGCIAETVWNHLHGFDPTAHIKDYDLVYFDDSDLSGEMEDRMATKCNGRFSDLNITIDVKNEARVHLWYHDSFGKEILPYSSAEDAISNWPSTATSVGIRTSHSGEFEIYVPFGLDDLFEMIVRPNKRQVPRRVYEEKARRWVKMWPRLRVIQW